VGHIVIFEETIGEEFSIANIFRILIERRSDGNVRGGAPERRGNGHTTTDIARINAASSIVFGGIIAILRLRV
jgi:hypothetical protein